MKKDKLNFTNSFTRTELKKFINYKFNGRAKVKKFSTFSANVVIFQVIVKKGNHLFGLSEFSFQSCFINNDGIMKATFTGKKETVKFILSEINFFTRFPESKIKMNFPTIKTKVDFQF